MGYTHSMAKPANTQLWIKLKLPGDGQIGPGKVDLLRKIGEHQSIAAAARDMNMSYRRAWLLVDEMNRLFTHPVVAKWQGGRSKGGAALTNLGEKLVENYDRLVARSNEINRDLLDEIGRSTGVSQRSPTGRKRDS